MEDPDLSEKHHGDPASLSLTDVRPKLNEKRLNLTPLDIGTYWMGKDGLQGSLVLSSHVKMVLLSGTIHKPRFLSESPIQQGANARPELLPKAGAQRTLKAVSSRPLFGVAWEQGWCLQPACHPSRAVDTSAWERVQAALYVRQQRRGRMTVVSRAGTCATRAVPRTVRPVPRPPTVRRSGHPRCCARRLSNPPQARPGSGLHPARPESSPLHEGMERPHCPASAGQ